MKSFHILLVDDHRQIRFTFQVALEAEGHVVDLAASVEETLTKTQRHRYDLLILDLRLGAESGLKLLTDLRARGVDSSVLMMTAHGRVADAVEAMKLGAIDFLEKPLEPSRLRAAVVDIIARSRATAATANQLKGSAADSYARQIVEAKHALNCRDFATARSHLACALELNNASADAHYLYGVLLELNGKDHDARRFYRRALDLYAGHSLAQAQLARLEAPAVSHRQWDACLVFYTASLASHSMHKSRFKTPEIIVTAALASLFALAQVRAGEQADASASVELTPTEKAAAKLKYNLFNPTPKEQLRPFNTDRPSKTDSPITVDAGRLQIEADFANYTYDRYNALGTDTRVETFLVAPTFLKVGLFQNADFQVLIPSYVRVHTTSTEVTGLRTVTVPQPGGGTLVTTVPVRTRQSTTVDGYGDMVFRLKINLVGNEGGKFAFAVIPFVKAPTAERPLGNGRVEGGINFPVNLSLPAGFTLFAQTRYDFLYNGDTSDYHALFSNSIGVSRAIPGVLNGKLSGYAEFASAVSSRRSDTDSLVLTADTGLIYQLTDNIAIDVNGFFGLTRGAPDVNVFGGIGVRF